MEELINTSQSDVVGRLAFKYMEMCKVDSSSDSESEASPRWSDVSKTCESGAPENPGAPRKLQRLRHNHQQVCADPYDGSSEDSSSSSVLRCVPRVKACVRRLACVDVPMSSSSDSELDCSAAPSPRRTSSSSSSPGAGAGPWDSGFISRSSVGSTPLSKRKTAPAGEPDDATRRKRRCLSHMELESATF